VAGKPPLGLGTLPMPLAAPTAPITIPKPTRLNAKMTVPANISVILLLSVTSLMTGLNLMISLHFMMILTLMVNTLCPSMVANISRSERMESNLLPLLLILAEMVIAMDAAERTLKEDS